MGPLTTRGWVQLSYVVRRAIPEDARAVGAVARKTWAATYQHIIPEAIQGELLAQWYAEDRLVRSIGNPNAAFFVAEEGEGGIVGFANAFPLQESGDAELGRLYILPEHQRKGLGRQLVRTAVDALRTTHQVERLFVQVETENWIGRRAYEALGFAYLREYEHELLGHVSRMSEMCLTVDGQ